jgi:hypothetical protein
MLENDKNDRYETTGNEIGSFICDANWNIRERSRKQFEMCTGRRCTEKFGLSEFDLLTKRMPVRSAPERLVWAAR